MGSTRCSLVEEHSLAEPASKEKRERDNHRASASCSSRGRDLASWYLDAAAVQFGATPRNRDLDLTDLTEVPPDVAVAAAERVLDAAVELRANQRPTRLGLALHRIGVVLVSRQALGGGNAPTADGVVPTIPRSGKVTWAVAWPTFTVVGKVAFRLEAEIDKGFPAAPYVSPPTIFPTGPPVDRYRFAASHHLPGARRAGQRQPLGLGDLHVRVHPVVTKPPTGGGSAAAPAPGVGRARRALSRGAPAGEVGERADQARCGGSPSAAVPLVPIAIEGTDRVMGIDNRLQRGSVRIAIGPALHPDRAAADPVAVLMDRWRRWIDDRLGG